MSTSHTVIDYVVVGSGLYGAVMAERIANVLKKSVLVIEKRPHIGGNCHSQRDFKTGIEYHTYGTHIFHTSNETVWRYLSQFTEMNGYRHQVLSHYQNRLFQMPFNLETINSFYGKNFRPSEARAFIESEIARDRVADPKNLEEKAISMIGRPLYEAFVKGYTEKQWGRSAKELPLGIITRIPVRFNYNEDYFNHCRWQGIPSDGYTAIFNRLLDHPLIRIETETDYFIRRKNLSTKYWTVYTGPMDRYFNYQFGKLGWRSIKLDKKYFDESDYQGTSVVNYPESNIPFTRIHEPLHLHPERNYQNTSSVVFFETSFENAEDPYYPIRSDSNLQMFSQYRELSKKESKILFGGRLGDYAYYDMDMTIAAALNRFNELSKELLAQ